MSQDIEYETKVSNLLTEEDCVALDVGRAQLALLRWARESEKAHGKAKKRSQHANERAQAFVNAEKRGNGYGWSPACDSPSGFPCGCGATHTDEKKGG